MLFNLKFEIRAHDHKLRDFGLNFLLRYQWWDPHHQRGSTKTMSTLIWHLTNQFIYRLTAGLD